MSREPWKALREDVHVGPDVTDAVMARLGYRPLPRRVARMRRLLHITTCLAVIGASIVGVAWSIDLGWKSRLGTESSALRAANAFACDPMDAARWEALGQSLVPLRRFVEEIDPPAAVPEASVDGPPIGLAARAPLGET